MTTSYNGFKAGDPSIFSPPGLDNREVPGAPGVHLAPGLHGGSIATVLFYVAGQLNARVEAGNNAPNDDWGYSFRPSKNDPDLISCHASGTAFDWNATKHPNGKTGTFSKAQVAEIRKILGEVNNLVHWGGDGWGAGSTVDEMHFEIREGASVMDIDACAERLTAPTPPPPPPVVPPRPPQPAPTVIKYGDRTPAVLRLQQFMVHTFAAYNHYTPTGYFGDATLAGVKEFQFRVGLVADGIVGPATIAALARFGFAL